MGRQLSQLILLVFNNGPAWVRHFLVRQWGGHDDAVAASLVTLAIQDVDLQVRLAALEIMAGRCQQQDLPLLSLALRDTQAAVRAAAAHALGQYRSRRAGSRLQEALKDPSPEVRVAAARGLGQIPVLYFSPALEQALADPDTWVRATAAASLALVGRADACVPLRVMAARDPVSRNRSIASNALAEIKKRTASPAEKRHQAGVDLLQILQDPRRSWEERRRAKAALVRMGDASLIPDLDQVLKTSQDDRARMAAVEILAALPWSRELQVTLIGQLHHVLPAARRGAIVALGEIGNREALFYLGEVAREGDQPANLLTLEDARLAREAIQKIRNRAP